MKNLKLPWRVMHNGHIVYGVQRGHRVWLNTAKVISVRENTVQVAIEGWDGTLVNTTLKKAANILILV